MLAAGQSHPGFPMRRDGRAAVGRGRFPGAERRNRPDEPAGGSLVGSGGRFRAVRTTYSVQMRLPCMPDGRVLVRPPRPGFLPTGARSPSLLRNRIRDSLPLPQRTRPPAGRFPLPAARRPLLRARGSRQGDFMLHRGARRMRLEEEPRPIPVWKCGSGDPRDADSRCGGGPEPDPGGMEWSRGSRAGGSRGWRRRDGRPAGRGPPHPPRRKAPSNSSKMKWTRSSSPPLNAPCGTRLFTSEGLAVLQMEVRVVHGQRRPWTGLQGHVDTMRQRVRAAAVHVPVDPVAGREPRQHRLGVDRLGVAVGRRGLRHHRQQPPPPDHPYRHRVVVERRPVAVDEPEHDVAGMGEAEVSVLLGGVFLPPHLLRYPPDTRPQRIGVHRPETPHQVRLLDSWRIRPAAVAGVRVMTGFPFPPKSVLVNQGHGPDAR